MSHWVQRISNDTLRESLLLMRVDRPIGTWLVLWPCLWSLSASQSGFPDLKLLVIFSLGSFVMRSAGCVINDLADRDFDPHVARTEQRPLAAKRISVAAAKKLLFGLLFVALVLAFQLNFLAIQLSFVGAFLALSYPFTKRFIHLPQFYLGASFGWGVIMAWAASTGDVNVEAWFIFAATLTWAAAYDTIYALMDLEDDLKIGVKSTAILFGRFVTPMVGLLYALTLFFLGVVGVRLGFTPIFYLSLWLALAHMIWQIWSIHKPSSPDVWLHTFLSNQWLGFIVFLGFLSG